MRKRLAATGESFEAKLINYIIKEYFQGDAGKLATRSGYTKQQIDYWRMGTHKPQNASLRWLLSKTIAPEFKVVCEFFPVNFTKKGSVRSELDKAFDGHGNSIGVYAFYDSMCNLIYLGKASTNIQNEMYQQLIRKLDIVFPKAVTKSPSERWEVTRFVSAYEVPTVDHLDYPKHVEALMLRIAKPVGNKVIGTIPIATPPKITTRK